MEREKQAKQQQDQSLLSLNPKLDTPTPTPTPTFNDRLKRDEWSEGAVSCLLEAYEAKWTLRNRAKLKGHDWEDVARHVSARGGGSKSAKTQTQCKNKIESMKKRYRSESAAADASSWPLYPRLDHLLRGNGHSASAVSNPPPVELTMAAPPAPTPVPAAAPPAVEVGSGAQKSHGSNDGDRLGKDEGDETNDGAKVIKIQELEKNPLDNDDSDSITPPIDHHFPKEKPSTNAHFKKKNSDTDVERRKKRGRGKYLEIGESIRWLAEVVVKSEQTRMETMKEIERMRVEADAKRGEMDLKRTEIIANTQLQIAKLFAKAGSPDEWKKPS